MDDFSARERKLERERQARIAAKKREQEQEAAAAQRYAEQQLQQREALAKRRAEREREEERRAEAQREDARLTGGLTWRRTYRCVAEPRDGDRVRLPDSSLSELTSAGLLQDATALTLELELVDADETIKGVPTDPRFLLPEEAREDELRVSATATHAGVLDFAAPDGHVGVPPKTMLSLVRGVPEVAERLAKGELKVRCRAVRLPTPKESSCALRPVAEGFHHGGADEAAVDLGAVLTKELGRGRHCCLTLGDWIAVSHDDRTVRLVVASLHPERALCVLSTDLSVDVLPPMVVEERLRKAQAQSEKEKRLVEERKQRAAAARAALESREIPADGAPVRVRLRFRDGSRSEATAKTTESSEVLKWLVDAQADDAEKFPLDARDWRLVSSYPRLALSRDALAGSLVDTGLVDARGGAVALLVEPLAVDDDEADPESPKQHSTEDVWARAAAFADAEAARERNARNDDGAMELDEATKIEAERRDLGGAEKAALFRDLVGRGLSNQLAAHAAQRYSSQLAELAQMGFGDDAALSVSLLDKYNGRLLRVVNALSDAREAQPPPPRPAPFAPPPSQQQASQQQARVAAAFKRHVAAGLPPNEAAAAALREVSSSN